MDWMDPAQDRGKWTGACECGNDHSGSVKSGEFLDQPKNFSFQGGLCSMELQNKI